MVTALTIGVTTITVTTADGNKTATCAVAVQLNTPVISGVKSGGDKKVKVTWGKVPSASKYALYYSTSKNGTYIPFGTGTTKLTATVDKLSYNKHYFKVQAISTNPACNSDFGEVKTFNTLLPPKNLEADNYGVSVNLTWSNTLGATGYKVYRATSAKGVYKRIKTIKKNSKGVIPRAYSDRKANTKALNYYKVKAIRTTKDRGGKKITVVSDLSDLISKKNILLLSWPVKGTVTSGFGYRIHPIDGVRKFHKGLDIAASVGTPVKAVAAGKVIWAKSAGAYGRFVVIDHGNNVITKYAHNDEILVAYGDTVHIGQVIAKAGSTGGVTGPHCHFEVWINEQLKNPGDYLS
jgi:murein DD-endopeptidase MepM/ murein hydrolase activator NlpD